MSMWTINRSLVSVTLRYKWNQTLFSHKTMTIWKSILNKWKNRGKKKGKTKRELFAFSLPALLLVLLIHDYSFPFHTYIVENIINKMFKYFCRHYLNIPAAIQYCIKENLISQNLYWNRYFSKMNSVTKK